MRSPELENVRAGAGRSTHTLLNHVVSCICRIEVVRAAQNNSDHERMPCLYDNSRLLGFCMGFRNVHEVIGGGCSGSHKWPRKFLFQTIGQASADGNKVGYLFIAIDSQPICENLNASELESKNMEHVERSEILRHINSVIGEQLDVGTYYRLVTLVAILPEDAEQRNRALHQLSDGNIPKSLDLVTVATGHAPMELNACMSLVTEPATMGEAVQYLAANHNMAMAQMAMNKAALTDCTPATTRPNYLDPFAKVREFVGGAALVFLGVFAGATLFA